MANPNRDVFARVLPNVKLSTKLDADGKEIQVERREDPEQHAKKQEMFDILVAAGYFRALIKGLSDFDKIVGGMTWCIDACDFVLDVDLLFHENLSIGQKISLTEKIVMVLPKMKCPHPIEPHQIQGLDYINVFPVVQWLVKRSVENRAAKSKRVMEFARSMFHNHFSLPSEKEEKSRHENAANGIQQAQDAFGPRRQYKRKDAGPDDEKTRVRMTLLEYGNNGLFSSNTPPPIPTAINAQSSSSALAEKNKRRREVIATGEDSMTASEIDVAKLLKNLYVANEDDCYSSVTLSKTERKMLVKHYADMKNEMSIDTKQLSERNQLKLLQATKQALERKLAQVVDTNRGLEKRVADEKHALDQLTGEAKAVRAEIRQIDALIEKEDKGVLSKIQQLVIKNEQLKQQEIKFKEECREEMARLQQRIREAREEKPLDNLVDAQKVLGVEKVRLQQARLQLAKKNRAIVSIQRQIDNIPDRTELAQYQRRFLELYNQVSAKHRETKQLYTAYNTLEDTKIYLNKELSLLNSIHDNYADGMSSAQAKDQYLKQLTDILEGVSQTKTRLGNRCLDEKTRRDGLASVLKCLNEQQRNYALAVKQFTAECKRNEELQTRVQAKFVEKQSLAATV